MAVVNVVLATIFGAMALLGCTLLVVFTAIMPIGVILGVWTDRTIKTIEKTGWTLAASCFLALFLFAAYDLGWHVLFPLALH